MNRNAPAATVLNLVLPGTGLIVAGNSWEGVAILLFFACAAHASIAAWLLVPAAWPRFVGWIALALTVVTWVIAQWLLRVRLRPSSAETIVNS